MHNLEDDDRPKCLVIGGSRGIGQAIAKHLMECDCHRSIKIVGLTQGLDLGLMPSAMRFEVDMFLMSGGTHIVYNSGLNCLLPLNEMNASRAHEVMNVNFWGWVHALEAFANVANQGTHSDLRMVGVSSVAARVPMTHSTIYCASKAAMTMAGRCAARELGPLGATVNMVSPGPTEGTDMTEYVRKTVPSMRGMTPDEAEAYQLAAIPIRRRVTVDEVAHAVHFLLSAGATGINGTDISVSGGM